VPNDDDDDDDDDGGETGPCAHPASCTMGTGPFPGVKRPGRGVNHAPPSSAEFKGRGETYLLPFWAIVACFWENITFILHISLRYRVFC